LDELKAKAVLEPTQENIEQYMGLQLLVLNQGSLFADIWRRTLWQNPELDYTKDKPTSSIGRNLYKENRINMEINTLKNINKRYGIFFVYMSTCPYCQKYGQILQDLKQLYEIEIRGISIDGIFLPNWEKDSFINNGQLQSMGLNITTVPATILYDNIENKIVPAGYGLMTADELIERIYILTQTKDGDNL
jgi:conjugal transfer pilus assembly protein TraF